MRVKLGKHILELKKHRENLLKDLLVYHPIHDQQPITHYFQGIGMTTNIDMPTTLGFSHTEAENQRAKYRLQMLGFKATRFHEAYIRKIRQLELSRLRTMAGL